MLEDHLIRIDINVAAIREAWLRVEERRLVDEAKEYLRGILGGKEDQDAT